MFACFDDSRLPDALRAVVTSERRLLTLAEDGIPVWAVAMASCGVYYRPWLRTAARATFVALALVSAFAAARDAFQLLTRSRGIGVGDLAEGASTISPVSSSSSASDVRYLLGSLGWSVGARFGFVDRRAVQTVTAAARAAARALARVLACVGYVIGRLVSHRLSLAMAARRAWRGLPGTWANAHGFTGANAETRFRDGDRSPATCRDEATGRVAATERAPAGGGSFRASVASPRRRKPETPARGAPTRVACDDASRDTSRRHQGS